MSTANGNAALESLIQMMRDARDESEFIKGVYRGQLIIIEIYLAHDPELMTQARADWDRFNAR